MKRQPKAIAVHYRDPVTAAALSLKNILLLLANFMYGTPERVQATMLFAIALALVGGIIAGDANQFSMHCTAAG